MEFFKTLKFMREKRNIPQNKMLNSKDSSQYSRIESGKAQLKLSTLLELTKKLGVSLTEFIQFSNVDQHSYQFAKEINYCIDNPDLTYEKQQLLIKYKQLDQTHLSQMTLEDIAYYYTIKAMLSIHWNEVKAPTTEEIENIFQQLIEKDFYSQYDYMLALNLIPYFKKIQIDTIAARMYPLEYPDKRTEKTKNYSSLLITNIISCLTYEMDYEAALKYVNIAQETSNLRDNYYFHLNILYHKNILLRFLENDTKYIEKAREVIQIMIDIGDKKTAKQFLDELNNLNTNPEYYKGVHNIPTVSIHK